LAEFLINLGVVHNQELKNLQQHGVWQYTLSEIYYEDEVEVALSQLDISATLRAA